MIYFLSYGACVFVLIVIHECGHYLAGRLGGIAASDMRIRLLHFPQHVELRDQERWVSPVTDSDTYVTLVWHYLRTRGRVFRYVAGGLVLETIATSVAATSCILAGYPKMALAIIAMSWCLLLPWLVLDGIMIARGRIFGDLSGLWQLAAAPTALLIIVMIAIRVALMAWAGWTPIFGSWR